jgi:hypothetical protein
MVRQHLTLLLQAQGIDQKMTVEQMTMNGHPIDMYERNIKVFL